MVTEAFDPEEITVFTGGPEVGQAFSALPFDHMIFTGATSVARHIMAAASRNLVPVTLELGGKSPVVISRSANLAEAIPRIMVGKMLNAGQVCIAPDYLMVPEENIEEVISLAKDAVEAMYPSLPWTTTSTPRWSMIATTRECKKSRRCSGACRTSDQYQSSQ